MKMDFDRENKLAARVYALRVPRVRFPAFVYLGEKFAIECDGEQKEFPRNSDGYAGAEQWLDELEKKKK
jgi:hypothetical protein